MVTPSGTVVLYPIDGPPAVYPSLSPGPGLSPTRIAGAEDAMPP